MARLELDLMSRRPRFRCHATHSACRKVAAARGMCAFHPPGGRALRCALSSAVRPVRQCTGRPAGKQCGSNVDAAPSAAEKHARHARQRERHRRCAFRRPFQSACTARCCAQLASVNVYHGDAVRSPLGELGVARWHMHHVHVDPMVHGGCAVLPSAPGLATGREM